MDLRPIVERMPKNDLVLHDHPLVNRVYQNRGVTSKDEIEYHMGKLIHPMELKGVKEAADLIMKHILNQSKIVVIGDYDCDGATSTTIAVQGMTICGAKDTIEYKVPDRLTQGYGLSPEVVADIAHLKPDLIVTVDNGIGSLDGVKAAKDLGCDVLVTDHHLPLDGGVLPCADVIVNPQQPGCTFPSKNIAGCGVIFYVIAGLRARMEEQGAFKLLGINKPNLGVLLDVLGIGTVADVVPLDENNRHIVASAIKMIRQGHARPIIYHLLTLAGKDYRQFTSTDIGFVLGPRINAAGRLETMDLAIQGMLTTNEYEAWNIAQRLNEINTQRKEMSSNHEAEANEIMETENIDSEHSGVCIYNADWHEGVVGILAGRVKEKLNRPTICLTMTHETAMAVEAYRSVRQGNYQEAEGILIESKEKMKGIIIRGMFRDGKTESLDTTTISDEQFEIESESYRSVNNLISLVKNKVEPDVFKEKVDFHVSEFGEIKGSCRSVPGVHLKHVLDHINKQRPEVLNKFGGHAMAAGVTVRLKYFDTFRKMFDTEVKKDLTNEIKLGKLEVDINDLDEDQISLDNAFAIKESGPWGQHFEEPVFSGKFEVLSLRPLQNKHLKMQVRVPGGKQVFDAICFSCIDRGFIPARQGNIVDLVYKMDINTYRGQTKVQLLVDLVQDPRLIHEIKEAKAFEDDPDTEKNLTGVTDEQKARNERFRQSRLSAELTP